MEPEEEMLRNDLVEHLTPAELATLLVAHRQTLAAIITEAPVFAKFWHDTVLDICGDELFTKVGVVLAKTAATLPGGNNEDPTDDPGTDAA